MSSMKSVGEVMSIGRSFEEFPEGSLDMARAWHWFCGEQKH